MMIHKKPKDHKWIWNPAPRHLSDVMCKCGVKVPGEVFDEIVNRGRQLQDKSDIGDWLRKELHNAKKST
jgi:hypothetical protein